MTTFIGWLEAMLIAATVIFISLAGIAHLERKGHDAKPSDEPHLIARSECLLRRREPLLSAWPVPALPASTPAMWSSVPIGYRPLRQPRELTPA